MFKDIVKASRSYRGYDESYHFIKKEEMEDFVGVRVTHRQRECTAVPLLFGMGRRSFTHPETDKLGESTAADETSAPGMCPTGFIIICQDLNLGASIPRYQKDVGIVARTMLLAAAERTWRLHDWKL